MYCIFLSIRLFSKGEWVWCFSLRNWQAIGYHVLPPSVDTGWFPWAFIRSDINFSATSMFLSLVIFCARISLFSGSIATQSHINSEPTFRIVSSTMYSEILFFLVDNFPSWWHFWIHFQMDTWLLFTRCRYDNAFTTFLNGSPRKYKYRLNQYTVKVFCFFYWSWLK